MAEINAGVNKQEIKNPVTSSNCYEQLEINEVLLNNALNGVSAPDKANKT